ncbi:MAG: class I adenylate-forming enzyme family protein [Bdellovibrionota bacterium]|nr:class I adenylate-forming enzyme family protein [Bdellovibrionota bacterium]
MYISGGENVYPREVEEVFNSFIEVDDTQIVSVPDSKWGEVGFAFVTLKSSISKEEINGRLKMELARYKHPRYLEFVDEFPLLANGKIDKRALKETALRSVDGI